MNLAQEPSGATLSQNGQSKGGLLQTLRQRHCALRQKARGESLEEASHW